MAFYIKTVGSDAIELNKSDYNSLVKIKAYICDKYKTEEYNIKLIHNGITIDTDEKVKNIKENDTLHLSILSPLVYSIGDSTEKKIIYDLEEASIFEIPELGSSEDKKRINRQNRLEITIHQWGGYQYGMEEWEKITDSGVLENDDFYIRDFITILERSGNNHNFKISRYFKKINIEAKDVPVLDYVISMDNCFNDVIINGDISEWNVGNVLSMDYMFRESVFNGDISKWNVSNVISMEDMFSHSKFNGDISKWNVSKVNYMKRMFSHSKFNGDISEWDVSNVNCMNRMFSNSKFNGDISEWDVSNVINMDYMFCESVFNGDISEWKVDDVDSMDNMFANSEFDGDLSKWKPERASLQGIFHQSNYKGKFLGMDIDFVKNLFELSYG